MKPRRRKLLLVLSICAALAALWSVDPTAIRLHRRYPQAKITDSHDDRWILPAFLHAHWTPADDLNFGRYLLVELSDQSTPIDCSGFAEFPVFLVVLNRCKVTDVQALISPPEVHVVFNDCDVSALPEMQRRELYPLPGSNRLSLNGP